MYTTHPCVKYASSRKYSLESTKNAFAGVLEGGARLGMVENSRRWRKKIWRKSEFYVFLSSGSRAGPISVKKFDINIIRAKLDRFAAHWSLFFVNVDHLGPIDQFRLVCIRVWCPFELICVEKVQSHIKMQSLPVIDSFALVFSSRWRLTRVTIHLDWNIMN
jgi:hypothetical protein